jgi:hypothetical protein
LPSYSRRIAVGAIKLFVFVPGKHFQPSLMLVGKARCLI